MNNECPPLRNIQPKHSVLQPKMLIWFITQEFSFHTSVSGLVQIIFPQMDTNRTLSHIHIRLCKLCNTYQTTYVSDGWDSGLRSGLRRRRRRHWGIYWNGAGTIFFITQSFIIICGGIKTDLKFHENEGYYVSYMYRSYLHIIAS